MGLGALAVVARWKARIGAGLAVLVATVVVLVVAVTGGPAAPAPLPGFAYITNGFSVIPLNMVTGVAGKPIPQPGGALDLAAAPDGQTIYVINPAAGTVTPISTVTNKPGRPIPAGSYPGVIAIPPSGTTAYVGGATAVTPINLATGTPGKPIPLPGEAETITVAPDGQTIYVTGEDDVNPSSTAITPINTATNTAGTPILVSHDVGQLAFALGGQIMYAVGGGPPPSVTPIDTRTGKTQAPVSGVDAVTVSPDGEVAYFSDTSTYTITPVNPLSDKPADRPVRLGVMPGNMIIEPDGTTAWVLVSSSRYYVLPPGAPIPPEAIIPVDLTTGSRGRPITVPQGIRGMTTTPDPQVLMLWCQQGLVILNMSTGALKDTGISFTGTLGIHIAYIPLG